MAVTVHIPNHALYQIITGNVNLYTDTIKAILLNTTYTPDIDADATLSDITSDQISTGYGYTQDDKTLANPSATENDTDDKATIEFDDLSWTASGGDIGPFGAMAFYSDTSSDDTITAIIDFGADYTIYDGSSFVPADIVKSMAQGS